MTTIITTPLGLQTHIFFISNFLKDSWHPQGWQVSCLMILYIFFPVMQKISLKFKLCCVKNPIYRILIVYITSMIIAIFWMLTMDFEYALYLHYSPIFRWPHFFMGMILTEVELSTYPKSAFMILIYFLFLVSMTILEYFIDGRPPYHLDAQIIYGVYEFIFAPFFCVLVLSFSKSSYPSSSFLEYVGTISYQIYNCHPVIYTIFKQYYKLAQWHLLFILPIVILVATIMHRIEDNLFNNCKSNVEKQKTNELNDSEKFTILEKQKQKLVYQKMNLKNDSEKLILLENEQKLKQKNMILKIENQTKK
jgi:peptidoglycan/LPS O-acetylase OafA/YrhL